jgi:hypothetical protein
MTTTTDDLLATLDVLADQLTELNRTLEANVTMLSQSIARHRQALDDEAAARRAVDEALAGVSRV